MQQSIVQKLGSSTPAKQEELLSMVYKTMHKVLTYLTPILINFKDFHQHINILFIVASEVKFQKLRLFKKTRPCRRVFNTHISLVAYYSR